MPGLILESSTSKSCLILARETEAAQTLFLDGGPGLALQIFKVLPDLLQNQTLDYIACGIGPGSFTGIRISATIAQALSYAKGIPLVGFCSLLSFTPSEEGAFFSAISAKSFGVHLLKGEKKSGRIHFDENPSTLSWEEAKTLLPKNSCIISPDSTEIQEKLSIPCLEGKPDPYFLANYTYNKFREGSISKTPFLDLLYLRSP